MDTAEIKKGWYKHFKGGVYEVLGTALHTETLETFVLYRHECDENPNGYWVRPLDMFLGEKTLDDGTKVRRFIFVGEGKPE
jgi:cyclomaltodextrinase / maltogenic alpha-amylase / neopullulanase